MKCVVVQAVLGPAELQQVRDVFAVNRLGCAVRADVEALQLPQRALDIEGDGVGVDGICGVDFLDDPRLLQPLDILGAQRVALEFGQPRRAVEQRVDDRPGV